KLFIIMSLSLTLLWKLPGRTDQIPQINNRIADFLRDQQFNVTETGEIINDMAVLRASMGACNMFVMKAAPQGWNRDMILSRASASDQILFVFQGTLYTEQPIWLAVAD